MRISNERAESEKIVGKDERSVSMTVNASSGRWKEWNCGSLGSE